MRESAAHDELTPTFDLIGKQVNLADPPRHTRSGRWSVTCSARARCRRCNLPFSGSWMDCSIAFMTRDAMDVIVDFAFPLPATVIATMLGLPVDDLATLRRWSDDYAALFGGSPSAITDEEAERASKSTQELEAYSALSSKERRARPGDDLISKLAAAEIDGNRLTDLEIVANANVLLGAGHDDHACNWQRPAGHVPPSGGAASNPRRPCLDSGRDRRILHLMDRCNS